MPTRPYIKMNTKSATKTHENLFGHLLRYQKIYLSALLIILAALPLFSNYLQSKPLLMGGESYYYLSSAREELPYHPLTLLFRIIPDDLAFLFPALISIWIILLFYLLAQKIKIPEKKMFFIVLFYLLTPTFMFTYLTISSYSWYLLLLLLGANLMLLENKKRYFSLLPLLLASWIDTFSGLLVLAVVTVYFFMIKKSKDRFAIILAIGITAVILLNAVLLNAPFFLGPFTVQDKTADLFSDLGSLSGVGIFALLLAIIGLATSWQKRYLPILLPALALFTTMYLLNTHTVFFLSLLAIVLAAVGFANLLEQHWKLAFLRNAVLLLLLLGISFSAVSYLDRLSGYSPTAIDQKTLGWIQRNTPEDAVILSAPENSYYVSYFAQRKAVFSLHQHYQQSYQLSRDIFSAFYIDGLFPLLEQNKVSIIYVSEEMRRTLPPGQEFLFLLQNERFKLLYFTEEAEVWSFDEAKQ